MLQMITIVKKVVVAVLFILLCQSTLSAQAYPIAAISDELIENADAVIRYEETKFVQTDLNNGATKYTIVITVLNEQGKHNADIIIPQDKFNELKSFSGAILNSETGKVIKKVSKNDLFTTRYSQDLVSDDKYSLYEYKPSEYPFTIRYEYEIRHKNGILTYPSFMPIATFSLAVEKSQHVVTIPQDLKLRYKPLNISRLEPIITNDGRMVSYSWSVENIKPISYERFTPKLSTLVPLVILAPEEFCMQGKCGNMSSWESLGSWHHSLIKGRDKLPDELVAKLNEMVKDCENPKQKVQRVYEYLQSTTRYVNKSLGIGGFEPMQAAEVAKSGFGDCKALSNYMKAMLNAIGIPSVYVAISTNRKELYLDFPSFTQMNHAILMVPLESDSLWLECTSQLIPFSYVHGNITGHQALLIKEDGSSICRVKQMQADVEEAVSMHVVLNENGDGQAAATASYRQSSYEEMLSFIFTMSRDEQINYLAESLKMQKVKIADLVLNAQHNGEPNLKLKFNLFAERYANKTGNRLFVPLSPLNIGNVNLLKDGKRTLDIFIASAKHTVDTLAIEIPDMYKVESIPESLTLQSDFGVFSVKVELDGQLLKVEQSISLNPGRYPAAKAKEFQEFLKKIDRESNRKAVFRLKS